MSLKDWIVNFRISSYSTLIKSEFAMLMRVFTVNFKKHVLESVQVK